MSKGEIKKIEGVWTEEDVTNIRNWAQSVDGQSAISKSIEYSSEQSKIFDEMVIVKPNILQTPITYTS